MHSFGVNHFRNRPPKLVYNLATFLLGQCAVACVSYERIRNGHVGFYLSGRAKKKITRKVRVVRFLRPKKGGALLSLPRQFDE